MGGSASKAARTLPKSASSVAARSAPTPTSGSSSRPHRAGSSGPPPPPPSASFPADRQQDQRYPVGGPTLNTADNIGQQGRRASPLDHDPTPGPVPGRNEGASSSKDAAIRRDAQDPDFIGQLHQLGPVQIPGQDPRTGQRSSQGPPSQMMRILRARQEREERLELEREEQQKQSGRGSRSRSASLDANTLGMLLDERKACTTRAALERLAVEYDVDLLTLESVTRRFNTPSIGAKLDTAEEEQQRIEGERELPPRMLAVWTEPAIKDERRRIESTAT